MGGRRRLAAATLPMLLVPLIGGRLAMRTEDSGACCNCLWAHRHWRRRLVIAALSDGRETRLAATVARWRHWRWCRTGEPAAVGVVWRLPRRRRWVWPRSDVCVRQASLAISIAALGLTLDAVDAAAGFSKPFALAALVALFGMIAAVVLLPAKSVQHGTQA